MTCYTGGGNGLGTRLDHVLRNEILGTKIELLICFSLTYSTAVALAETFQAKMALVSDWQNLVCCLISMNFRFSLVCLARLSPCLATRD